MRRVLRRACGRRARWALPAGPAVHLTVRATDPYWTSAMCVLAERRCDDDKEVAWASDSSSRGVARVPGSGRPSHPERGHNTSTFARTEHHERALSP